MVSEVVCLSTRWCCGLRGCVFVHRVVLWSQRLCVCPPGGVVVSEIVFVHWVPDGVMVSLVMCLPAMCCGLSSCVCPPDGAVISEVVFVFRVVL